MTYDPNPDLNAALATLVTPTTWTRADDPYDGPEPYDDPVSDSEARVMQRRFEDNPRPC